MCATTVRNLQDAVRLSLVLNLCRYYWGACYGLHNNVYLSHFVQFLLGCGIWPTKLFKISNVLYYD